MARWLLTPRHGPAGGTSEPLAGLVVSVVLSLLSISALSAFMTQRYLAVRTWKQLPLVQWLVFAIYTDSFLFVLATGILQFGFGVGYSGEVCESAILLCLACYVTTKLIYLFLVEKAYIIRSSSKKPRLKSKLYLFNSFGMIGAYCVVVVPNFVLRFARVENGECIIGMQRPAMIPLIVFDLLVNVYLTIIFLKPLSALYSYKNLDRAPGNRRLKTMAVRTFVGCICTLTSSIVNLSVLVGLDGEPGWVCLMCCNSDILFSAAVIHWVTSRDSTTTGTITSDDAGPSSGPRSHNAEQLSAIPARAARHRLPDDDTDVDADISKRGIAGRGSPNAALSAQAVVRLAEVNETKISERSDATTSLGSATSRGSNIAASNNSRSPLYPIAAASSPSRSSIPSRPPNTAIASPTTTGTATAETVPPRRNRNRGRDRIAVADPARHRSASEVRVDVDYGTTTTTILRPETSGEDGGGGGRGREEGGGSMEEPVRLGNTVVVIGAGSKLASELAPGLGLGDAGIINPNGRPRSGTGRRGSGWR